MMWSLLISYLAFMRVSFYIVSGARISFQEFQPIFASVSKEKAMGSASDFVEGLRMFDSDGSGMISVAELRHILTNIGELK